MTPLLPHEDTTHSLAKGCTQWYNKVTGLSHNKDGTQRSHTAPQIQTKCRCSAALRVIVNQLSQ